jgi:sigma-B regulation protein RsbU (phosphoserine phosphatase)
VRVDGWDLAYHYEGSGPMSGDTCDIERTGDGELHFLVGDISGKGLGAALLMSHLHASFRALRPLELPLVEMVARANRAFCKSTAPEAYATLCYGVTRPTGQIEFCNAGHPAALWLRGGEIAELRSTALPVGLFAETAFAARKFVHGRP